MKTLQHDNELDNAIYFAQYVTVMKDGRVIGGGMIEAYNEDDVLVNGKRYSRKQSILIESPAPEMYIQF